MFACTRSGYQNNPTALNPDGGPVRNRTYMRRCRNVRDSAGMRCTDCAGSVPASLATYAHVATHGTPATVLRQGCGRNQQESTGWQEHPKLEACLTLHAGLPLPGRLLSV